MSIETTRWDAADHLGSNEAVLAYLEAVFENGDPALIAAALGDVARARGIAAAEMAPRIGLVLKNRTIER